MKDFSKRMREFEEELSKIGGMKSLKVQLQSWANQLTMDERRRKLSLNVGVRKPPHMAFLGNPGTGKTMVARTMAKLLHMLDLIPTDKVVEVQRTDLVGEYIGSTGLKTREKIESAKGGILFIDEAYRLMPQVDVGSCWDFGIEALEEIMSSMDSKKVVVIFAGYRDRMEKVISANAGFRRRVTKFFYFDDYTCQDLANILLLKMSTLAKDDENSPLYGFKLHPSCTLETIAETIERESTQNQRSQMNGGLVDTMLAGARESLDKRLIGTRCKDVDSSLVTITMDEEEECKDIVDDDSLVTITVEDLAAGLRLMRQSFTEDDQSQDQVEDRLMRQSYTENDQSQEEEEEDVKTHLITDERVGIALTTIYAALKQSCAGRRNKKRQKLQSNHDEEAVAAASDQPCMDRN